MPFVGATGYFDKRLLKRPQVSRSPEHTRNSRLWCGKFGVTLRIGGAFIRVRIILAVPRHRLELLICPLGFDRRAAPLVAHVTDAELEGAIDSSRTANATEQQGNVPQTAENKKHNDRFSVHWRYTRQLRMLGLNCGKLRSLSYLALRWSTVTFAVFS